MSTRAALEAALERELGASSVGASRREVAGAGEEADRRLEIEPGDGAALAAALRVLAEHGGRAIVRGGGSHDALGNAPIVADAVISTRALSGIEELDTADGVVRVRVGTPLAELQRAVEPHGWEVPLGAPESATVGGTLAAAAIGPRRLAQGPPRDCVLGLDVTLATGERTHCGGRVVKNVTGFDLAKLYVGSLGCLGVIEAAWLRLRPRPEAAVVLAAPLETASEATRLAISAARLPTARCAALLDPAAAHAIGVDAAAGGAFVVELAGVEPSVREDARFVAEACGAAEVGASCVDALSALQSGDEPIRARIATLPSSCGRALQVLRESGARLIVHAGLALLYAQWLDRSAASRAVEAVERTVREARGEARFERLPDELKRTRDVFAVASDARQSVERMQPLMQRFDPAGVLASGRVLGRL